MSNILKETKGGVNKIVAVVNKRGGGSTPCPKPKIGVFFKRRKICRMF